MSCCESRCVMCFVLMCDVSKCVSVLPDDEDDYDADCEDIDAKLMPPPPPPTVSTPSAQTPGERGW